MDLWQLQIFCKVVELKSFSKAGKSVFLTQPTVSSHIKELEDHFGSRLIDRLAREAIPTKAGELLYHYARRMIVLKEKMERAMAEFPETYKGLLVIGGSTIPGVHILPKIIGRFVNKYPEVMIRLNIGDSARIIKDTISGIYEIGIVGAKFKDRRIVQEKLIEDEMMLIVPADHPLSTEQRIDLERLLKEPFILREPGSGTRRSFQTCLEKAGLDIDDLTVVAEMGSTGAIIEGIKNHVGISIVSTIAVAQDIKAGRLYALNVNGLNLKRSFYMTRHKGRSLSPLSQLFIDYLEVNLST